MKALLQTKEYQNFVCEKCFMLSFDKKIRKLEWIQMKLYFPDEPA